jgi:dipeptidyl aminopeptidase/acylaminoacyl peptidase
VWPCEAECGEPQWEFGYATYAFLDATRIVILCREDGLDRLRLLDLHSGEAELLPIPVTSVKPYLTAAEEQLAYLGGGPDDLPAPLTYDLDGRRIRLLASERVTAHALPWRRFQFSGAGGHSVWVNFYPPAPTPDQYPPPLLLRAHPGPRSQARIRLDLEVRFFTSRGYAVADVDYRGSTGYGRFFRDTLVHAWGVADAEDCAVVAQHLSEAGLVDPYRIVIYGESAGGYTALRVLATTEDFAAAICVSAIVDLEQYRQHTHKFQRYETDRLVGSFPEDRELYRQRSPANLVGAINRPVLLVHGPFRPDRSRPGRPGHGRRPQLPPPSIVCFSSKTTATQSDSQRIGWRCSRLRRASSKTFSHCRRSYRRPPVVRKATHQDRLPLTSFQTVTFIVDTYRSTVLTLA